MKKKQFNLKGIIRIIPVIIIFSCNGAQTHKNAIVQTDKDIEYCHSQIKKTLSEIDNDTCSFPRSIDKGRSSWYMIDIYDWTSGFWPGILWYDYENTKDPYIKETAIKYTNCLQGLLSPDFKGDHDLGFQFLCSFVNGYRLTGDENYKQIALKGADKLAQYYNPKVGTILSWAHMVEDMGWPHNTIMDNMMNLELLFWAAKNGGNPSYYNMAERHARVTMLNQFRDDYTNYHVAVYDTVSGSFIKGVTNQGYSDESFWARGQAWGIYGYTMVYRETHNKEFLRFAEKIADVYLKRLPEDYVPYWDFDDPAIPNAPKDASSAAIVASAFIELSQLQDDKEKAVLYKNYAEKMLKTLSSDEYKSESGNLAFILHSTGNYPAKYEIDASINYADYYYLEALTRYKNMNLENRK